ncbi:hypothetical protein SLEP1_g59909 [Rubroshorea leprosula]|uniref:Uncharacterized protein n=1 Tax=Rubroshorea leprosula TaxID=152421 RepID=A0AAV5MWY6_9ROSI|nr:hypothetical protein SLEP1_g59909 [Rubroshorea leprosula]
MAERYSGSGGSWAGSYKGLSADNIRDWYWHCLPASSLAPALLLRKRA